jgi:hypothetical protein
MHVCSEAEIPLLFALEAVDVLQLITPGALSVKGNLGKAKRSDYCPPVVAVA